MGLDFFKYLRRYNIRIQWDLDKSMFKENEIFFDFYWNLFYYLRLSTYQHFKINLTKREYYQCSLIVLIVLFCIIILYNIHQRMDFLIRISSMTQIELDNYSSQFKKFINLKEWNIRLWIVIIILMYCL